MASLPTASVWFPFTLASCVLTGSVCGCGGPAVAPEQPTPAPEQRPSAVVPRAATDLRRLAADATFADLVSAARTLDDRRDQLSDAGCLIDNTASGYRLAADLAVAVRPLPPPAADLDGELTSAERVNALSRWGRAGSGSAEQLTFVAVTTTLPTGDAPADVWIVTDQGVYVRSTQEDRGEGATTAARAAESLTESATLYVSAESDITMGTLTEVLRAVPVDRAGRVALAVALTRGTRLPEPPTEPDTETSEAAHCPEGMPPVEGPLGELEVDAIRAQLGRLTRTAQSCVTIAQLGPAGAHARLRIRIGSEGQVTRACVRDPSTPDERLSLCLVRAAENLRFDRPDPPGTVDVDLPLVLAPVEVQRQRPLCH